MARPTKKEQISGVGVEHHFGEAVDPDAVDRAIHAMPSVSELKIVSDVFRAISDPTRLRILAVLEKSPLCVSDIALVLGKSESAISHQLRLFRSLGLAKTENLGRRVYYSLDDKHVESLYESVLQHIRHTSKDRLQKTGEPKS